MPVASTSRSARTGPCEVCTERGERTPAPVIRTPSMSVPPCSFSSATRAPSTSIGWNWTWSGIVMAPETL